MALKIENLKEILPEIKGKDEFIVIDKGDYIAIDYVYQDENTFDSEVALECRGIKFNTNGTILARPFQKFFNHGERGHKIDIDRPHNILDKLDGSMIHPARVNGDIVLMTRKGITDTAEQAWKAVTDNHKRFFEDAELCGITPIFEYTGPDNRIVLPYDEHRLTLIGARNTITGNHCDTRSMVSFHERYGIPLVEGFKNKTGISDLDSFLHEVRFLKDKEGFVVRYHDGDMVKVKANEYVLRHRAKSYIGSTKAMLAVIKEDCVDDILPILGPEDREIFEEFVEKTNRFLGQEVAYVETLVLQSKDMSRKDFALQVVAKQEDYLRPVLFGHLDGKSAREILLRSAQLEKLLDPSSL